MFHKIKDVIPSHDYCLSVRFSEGCTKIYDVKPLFDKIRIIEPEMVVKSAQSVNKIIVQLSYFIAGNKKQLFAHGYRCAA